MRIYGFFMDLKAAFDKVDRKELWKALEEGGTRNTLIERIKKIYKSTKNAVRVRGKMSFWTEKGVRQGCPLSPVLFLLLIADVENEMGKGQIGGVQIGKSRIWSLAIHGRPGPIGKKRRGNDRVDSKNEKIHKKKEVADEHRKIENCLLQKRGRKKKEDSMEVGRRRDRRDRRIQVPRIHVEEEWRR